MLIKPLGISGGEQRYCSCCYNLLGNAISLISESYQSASRFHSHCAVPVCPLPQTGSQRASSCCLLGRRQQHSVCSSGAPLVMSFSLSFQVHVVIVQPQCLQQRHLMHVSVNIKRASVSPSKNCLSAVLHSRCGRISDQ